VCHPGNYEAAQLLIDQGIDLTIRDDRWNGTAEGWAIHAYALGQPPVNDRNMAEFLARSERERKRRGTNAARVPIAIEPESSFDACSTMHDNAQSGGSQA
jgi:RecB family exonuclease